MKNTFKAAFLCQVCRDFNKDKCSRGKPGEDSCTSQFGTVLQHVCGTVKSVGGESLETALCPSAVESTPTFPVH